MSNTERRIPEIAVRRIVKKAAAVPCLQRYECAFYIKSSLFLHANVSR